MPGGLPGTPSEILDGTLRSVLLSALRRTLTQSREIRVAASNREPGVSATSLQASSRPEAWPALPALIRMRTPERGTGVRTTCRTARARRGTQLRCSGSRSRRSPRSSTRAQRGPEGASQHFREAAAVRPN